MASTSFRAYKSPASSNQDDGRMDGVNRNMADSLSKKVSQLKSLAIDLDVESRDHIPLLENIGDDVDTAGSRMGGSSGRIRNINRTLGMRGCKLTYGVAAAVVMLLFFMYYLLMRSTT